MDLIRNKDLVRIPATSIFSLENSFRSGLSTHLGQKQCVLRITELKLFKKIYVIKQVLVIHCIPCKYFMIKPQSKLCETQFNVLNKTNSFFKVGNQ
jgi:hypothetical protein